ncbi:MAG: HNH endonuclease family protein [Mycobacterium sp.]|uniref:HNH endonuclease family protein n=1 Tax=Mycobacterium sp. TaxID=1785 RepID=UPI003C44B50F
MTRRLFALVAAAAVAAGIALAAPGRSDDNDSDAFTTAAAKLETLPIKGRAPKTGYSRDAFGQAWTDDVRVEGGHNGCDTRNDILHRDLTDITVKLGSHGCTVLSGTLNDPYTGKAIPFTRGAKTSTAVQIDHVVALGDAWQKGAHQLDPQTRQDFANDPRNLQATDGKANEQKKDGDAATWLPPNKAYRCTYVSRQVEVKAAYHLWATPAEHDAIAGVLTGCGATPPSVPQAAGPAPVEPPPPPATSPVPEPDRAPGTVHPGAFCSRPGATGVSSTGKPMVCGLAKDGRHRWVSR